jgi:hypothetical protein
MSYTTEVRADQKWQRSNKFSPLRYLNELCFKALTLALVGRHGAHVPSLSEVPSDLPHRNKRP